MNNKTKKRRISTPVIIFVIIVFFVLTGIMEYLQIRAYESGVMDVYALQQDGYVQLVLDQINLLDEGSDELIVNNILATLDSSSNKYWTLSKDDAMIFIKDVQETNKYMGFTTATYYVTESAKEFISELQTNRVIHRTIDIGNRTFIASGVQFEFSGNSYRICLLTNSEIALEHNIYLGAKINLYVIFVAILSFTIIGGVFLSVVSERRRKQIDISNEENRALRERIELLTEKLTENLLFDTQFLAFRQTSDEIIINKLETKNVWPLGYMILEFPDAAARNGFLNESQAIFDRKIFKVLCDDRHLKLYILRENPKFENMIKLAGTNYDMKVIGRLTFAAAPEDQSLKEFIYGYDSSVFDTGDDAGRIAEQQAELKKKLSIENTDNSAAREEAK